MSKVRFEIDYVAARGSRRARLNITRHEIGMIGHGRMRPMLFQQLLDGEAPDGDQAAMTDMWSEGEVEAFLQSMLDQAWRIGLRPAGSAPTTRRDPTMPAYAAAEVSPAVKASADALRQRLLSERGENEKRAA